MDFNNIYFSRSFLALDANFFKQSISTSRYNTTYLPQKLNDQSFGIKSANLVFGAKVFPFFSSTKNSFFSYVADASNFQIDRSLAYALKSDHILLPLYCRYNSSKNFDIAWLFFVLPLSINKNLPLSGLHFYYSRVFFLTSLFCFKLRLIPFNFNSFFQYKKIKKI